MIPISCPEVRAPEENPVRIISHWQIHYTAKFWTNNIKQQYTKDIKLVKTLPLMQRGQDLSIDKNY
jgi:hypothetical protein